MISCIAFDISKILWCLAPPNATKNVNDRQTTISHSLRTPQRGDRQNIQICWIGRPPALQNLGITPALAQVTNVTVDMLDNQNFLSLMTIIWKKEIEKAVNINSKKNDWSRKHAEDVYSTARPSTAISDRLTTISPTNGQTKRAYFYIWRELSDQLTAITRGHGW